MFRLLNEKEYSVNKKVNGVVIAEMTKQPEFCSMCKPGCLAVFSPSVYSLLDTIDSDFSVPQREKSSSHVATNSFFNKFPTFEKAMEVFRQHPETLRNYKHFDDRLLRFEEAGNDVFFDVVGDYLDVGLFLSDEPEHFGNMVMGNLRSVYVTVYINTGALADISESAINHRAQRIFRLIDWLENQRVRCQVVAFSTNACSHVEVVMKDYDSYLDLDALAIVTSTDFHRRIVFRLREYSKTWASGYGYTAKVSEGTVIFPMHLKEGNGVQIISENQNNISALDKTYDALESQLKQTLAEQRSNRLFIV